MRITWYAAGNTLRRIDTMKTDNKKCPELGYFAKVWKYAEGKYKMNPPPVCTAKWTQSDWIRWIDTNGIWID
jgi:hypothetical protein